MITYGYLRHSVAYGIRSPTAFGHLRCLIPTAFGHLGRLVMYCIWQSTVFGHLRRLVTYGIRLPTALRHLVIYGIWSSTAFGHLRHLVTYDSRPGWAPDPLMVGIRSPDGLVVWSYTSHPRVLGSIPKREEPGKTGAPCVKVPGSSRVPVRDDRLIHTGLGSSSLIAHVLHSAPPPTRTAL